MPGKRSWRQHCGHGGGAQAGILTGARPRLPYLQEEDEDGQQMGQVTQQAKNVHGAFGGGLRALETLMH